MKDNISSNSNIKKILSKYIDDKSALLEKDSLSQNNDDLSSVSEMSEQMKQVENEFESVMQVHQCLVEAYNNLSTEEKKNN